MRAASFIQAFLLMLSATTSAPAQSFYKKYFPPDNIYSTIPWAVSQRPDGKYWMAGGVYEAPSRLYITGLDEQGLPFASVRLLADQSAGGEGYVSGNMVATGDNGCAALLSQSISAQSDGWILVKMNADAEVEWAKEIAGVGVAGYGVDFLNYSPDGIWVYSRLWALNNGLSQSYFARVGLDGTVHWERVLALPSFLGTNTTLLPDGRLLAILNTGSLAPLGHLLALTPGGDLQPLLTIQNTVVMDAVQHPDGRLFVVGHTPDIGTLEESQLILGCYHQGQFKWAKTFTLSKEFYTSADVLLNADLDSLTVTVSNTAASGARYLLRFDLSGQLAWARWLPSFENLQSHTAVTSDGGFLWVSTSPDLKPVVAKTDAAGQLTGCPMASVCQLDVRDTVLQQTGQNFNFQNTTRMQSVTVNFANRVLQSDDYCAPQPLLDADIFTDTIACRNTALKLERNPAASGFSEWRFPGVLTNPVTGVANPTVIFPDTGTFTVTHLLTLAGCTDTGVQSIRVLPLPVVQLPIDQVLCPGDSIEINAIATSGVTYLWDNGLTTPQRILTSPNNYSVTVANTDGCTASDQVLMVPAQVPGLLLPSDTFFCANAAVTIAPALYPGWHYSWDDGFPETARTITQPGVYTILVESSDGCLLSDSILVSERTRPEILIVATQPDSCGIQLLRLQNDALHQISWSTGANEQQAEVTQSGQYTVTAGDGYCTNTGSIEVAIERCPECFIYFPNVIQPQSGTENGLFLPQTGCALSDFSVRIYDRWGALVFESRNASQPWDGTFQGSTALPGVYLFVASGILTFENLRTPFEASGSVAVVR